jgi:hypothetical protein
VVEQLIRNQQVVGSIPTAGSTFSSTGGGLSLHGAPIHNVLLDRDKRFFPVDAIPGQRDQFSTP